MIGHRKPLGTGMIGHRRPLGKEMIGHKAPLLAEMGVAQMTRKLDEQKKAGGLERAKRNQGWNQGGQYGGA